MVSAQGKLGRRAIEFKGTSWALMIRIFLKTDSSIVIGRLREKRKTVRVVEKHQKKE